MKDGLSRRDFLKLAASSSAVMALGPVAQVVAQGSAGGDPIVITMVEAWFGVPQFQDSLAPVMDAISAKMQSEGLNIAIRSLTLDDHRARYPVLYASGADFTMGFDAPWYFMNSLRDQDALLELEDLIAEHGQNLQAAITDRIYNANFEFGHLYGIPAAFYYRSSTGIRIREDLRVAYDAPAPTSGGGYASLQPFLEAVKENNPDLIPYANSARQSMIRTTYTNPMHVPTPGISSSGMIIPNFQDGRDWTNLEDVPSVIEAATLLREWYDNGLINQSDLPSADATENLFRDYMLTGRTAGQADNEPDIKSWQDRGAIAQALGDDVEIKGYELAGLLDGSRPHRGVLKQFNFVVFNALAPEEQSVAGVQFFDWLSTSQENLDLWMMGVEGENYIAEPDLRFSEIEGVDPARNYRRQWFVSGFSGRYQRQSVDMPQEILDAITHLSTAENWEFDEYEGFTPDLPALEQYTTQLSAVYDEAIHGLATAQVPVEDARAHMKNLLDSAGRQELREALQAQYDAFVSSME